MVFLARVPCVDHWDDDSILRLCGRMEKLVASYNDVVTVQGEPANEYPQRATASIVSPTITDRQISLCADYFYFVAHGDCRLVREYPLPPPASSSPRCSPSAKPPRRQRSCVVEICSVGSPQFLGSYEVVHGLAESAFSVLVASPMAVLFRVDRVDFRQTMLKDPQTDLLVRADARALADRMDARRVLRDLDGEARWTQYKRELVDSILTRHRQTHVPPMGPRPSMAAAHRTARETPLPFLSARTKPSAAGSLSAREALGKAGASSLGSPVASANNSERRRPTIDPETLPRRPPGSSAARAAGDKKWIDVRLLLDGEVRPWRC